MFSGHNLLMIGIGVALGMFVVPMVMGMFKR